MACGAALLAIGIWMGITQYLANYFSDSRLRHEIQLANSGQPSSVPSTNTPTEDAFANYHVAPDAPRYIFIPAISVRAMVKLMGLTTDNHIEAPNNVHDAGWFTQSAKPGKPGAMVIDGHVANWATESVFYQLKSVRPHDAITIERGDGQKITYRVVRSQSYDASSVDMDALQTPVNPAKPGLNLITCDGKVINNNDFSRRLIVFAQQE